MATSYSPKYSAVPYNAGGAVGKRKLDIYYPDGSPPADGWPVVVQFNCTAFQASSRDGVASTTDGHDMIRYWCLVRGWALVDVEVTVTDVGGAPVGGGMWRDPYSDAEYNMDGSGDEIWHSDAKTAIQWTRYNAQDNGFNPNRIAAVGRSAGSACAMATAGYDAIDQTNAIPMRTVSSRPNALIDVRMGGWYWGTCRDSAVGGADTTNTNLRRASNPAQLATDLEDAIQTHVLHASPQWEWMQPGARELNRRLPVYSWTNTVPASDVIQPPTIDYSLDADNVPVYTGTSLGGLVDKHDPFGGLMRIKGLRALDTWHNTHSKLVGMATYTVGGITPDEVISDQDLAAQDQMDWLEVELPPNDASDTGGGGVGLGATPGAHWFTVDDLGAAYPLNGQGTTTDVAADSILSPRGDIIIEGIYVDSLAGEDPGISLVDSGGNVFNRLSLPAVSTGGRGTEFLNVQRGVTDYGAAADSATPAISAVVVADTYAALMNMRLSNAGRSTPDSTVLVNRDVGEDIAIGSTTSVLIARYSTGENVDHRCAWEARSYIGAGAGDLNQIAVRSVAEYTIAAASAAVTTAAISSIATLAKTVAIRTGMRNDLLTGGADSSEVTVVINGDKTLTITRGGVLGEWKGTIAVVEFVGSNWAVKSWSKTMTTVNAREAATLSSAISTDWTHAFIIGTHRVPNLEVGNEDGGMVWVPPTSGLTTIDLFLHSGADNVAGAGYVANGWVVENADITVMHDNAGLGGTLSLFGSALQTLDQTVPSTDLATSFLLMSGVCAGSTSTLPLPSINCRMKSATVVELWRGAATGGASMNQWAIQIVSTAAPGLDYDTRSVGRFYKFGKEGMAVRGRVGAFVNETGSKAAVFYRVRG